MHTHFKQDEVFTVLSGKMGHQILGEEPKIAHPGDTVFLKEELHISFGSRGRKYYIALAGFNLLIPLNFFLERSLLRKTNPAKRNPNVSMALTC